MMASELRHEKLKAQIEFYNSNLSMSHFEHQMQDMEPHAGEVFHPPAGITWKGFLDKRSPSSSKSMAESSADLYRASEFHKPTGFSQGFSNHSESLVIAPAESAWLENRMLMDDSSLRFMDRPSQGLSLSLCADKPSHIGIQSFEMRDQSNHHLQIPSSSFQHVFSGKAWDFHSGPELLQEEHHLRSSKYLSPAQQLLTEFCSLGAVQNENGNKHTKQPQKNDQWEAGVSSSKNPNFHSSDLLELQKRKAKLLSMLDEADRRYRQFCDQMRVLVSSFEAVAGPGSATVYSRLASKAMSKHFRRLKDGIVGQVKATKKAMGEKDAAVAPGTTRGETPRLKMLDQSLRQQRAFQKMGMESHPWRPQRGLPERSVSILRAWLFEHFLHPYPSDVDKHILARQTGLSRSQVSNWFINARVRLWKPMVEEMYLEETTERETKDHICGITSGVHENGWPDSTENPNPSLDSQQHLDDQKPSSDQLLPHSTDSDSLSSIINSDKRNSIINGKDQQKQHDQDFARPDAFGIVDLDFSSYSHSSSVNNSGHHNFGGSNGVSLTLGLQQHGGGGMGGLSFSPAGSQHSFFISRQHMDDCQPIQYSILEGESQNLPYRSLMGAQLLHDFTG